jgi:hypothetical protein
LTISTQHPLDKPSFWFEIFSSTFGYLNRKRQDVGVCGNEENGRFLGQLFISNWISNNKYPWVSQKKSVN